MIPEADFEIRPALDHERPVLDSLARRAKAHWGYAPSLLDAWALELAVSASQIASGRTWVSHRGPTLLGFYVLEPAVGAVPRAGATPRWSLEHFWVAPDAMGRGVGRAMLAHASRLARTAGADTIEIDADPNAALFYERCGAVRVGSCAAPIPGAPGRVRPQLRLSTQT